MRCFGIRQWNIITTKNPDFEGLSIYAIRLIGTSVNYYLYLSLVIIIDIR